MYAIVTLQALMNIASLKAGFVLLKSELLLLQVVQNFGRKYKHTTVNHLKKV